MTALELSKGATVSPQPRSSVAGAWGKPGAESLVLLQGSGDLTPWPTPQAHVLRISVSGCSAATMNVCCPEGDSSPPYLRPPHPRLGSFPGCQASRTREGSDRSPAVGDGRLGLSFLLPCWLGLWGEERRVLASSRSHPTPLGCIPSYAWEDSMKKYFSAGSVQLAGSE